MNRLIATLCLGAALSAPLAARADDMGERVTEATKLVNRTLIKNLQTGSPWPGEDHGRDARGPGRRVRKELNAEFEKQRTVMVEGLSKEYAQKFSLAELKHLDEIYSDPVYEKFQTMNADPNSSVTAISQNSVTKLLNMLAVAAATDNQPPGSPSTGGAPTPIAPPAPAPK